MNNMDASSGLPLRQVIQGDCIEVMKRLPNECVDFVLADPPFNIGLSYSKRTLDGVDSWLDADYSQWCCSWLKQLYRVAKNGSFAIVFSSDVNLFQVFQAVTRSGYTYHHMLKWYKPTCQRALSGTVFFNRTELSFVLSKGKPDQKRINRKNLYQDTIIERNTSVQDGDTGHPATRPTRLYEKILSGFTSKGDVVLDPFLGSGTTAIASEKLQRMWIGIEIDGGYCAIARNRLDPWINQTRLDNMPQVRGGLM